MKQINLIAFSLCLLLIGLLSRNVLGETFLVGDNKRPLVIEADEYEDQSGTILIKGALVIKTGAYELTLVDTEAELWDYNEETGEYDSFELLVDAQDFLDQLYGKNSFFYMRKKINIRLTYKEGSSLVTRIPLDSKKKYFLVDGLAGEYFSVGMLNFEIPKFQLQTQIGLGLDDRAFFFTGDLSGLGAFLSPISMAGFGVALSKVFKFYPKTEFEIDPKEMSFNGQTVIMGTASIPKLPISLTGELVTLYDGPLFQQRKLGFNGELVASYKFSGELGLSLHLGNASGLMNKSVLGDRDHLVEVTFSGVQDPTLSFLPKDFPIQLGKEVKLAGRMSTRLPRSYFIAHSDFEVLNIPLSQGRMRIDSSGVVANGFMRTPVSRISFSGAVSKKAVSLKGKAQARLDIKGLVKKVETVTNGAICGFNFATSGAKCGYNFVFGGVGCAVAKISLNSCQKRCRNSRTIGGPRLPGRVKYCEIGCFAKVKAMCKKAKKCKFPKTCKRVVKIPNQKLGYISAELDLIISNQGLGGQAKASFCPLRKKCVRLPSGEVKLDLSNVKKPKVCVAKGVAGSNKGLCVGF